MTSELDTETQAEVDKTPDLHTFWCPTCKNQWELPVGSTSHTIHWKNGITWYEAVHRGLMQIVK